MAREVWCAAGNKMVTLPDGAFNQSLMAAHVNIAPCSGCEHAGHAKKVTQIDGEVKESAMVGVKRVPHLIHAVQVIETKSKFHVQCTCNCYPKTIKN